jgi:hypothetical protein
LVWISASRSARLTNTYFAEVLIFQADGFVSVVFIFAERCLAGKKLVWVGFKPTKLEKTVVIFGHTVCF